MGRLISVPENAFRFVQYGIYAMALVAGASIAVLAAENSPLVAGIGVFVVVVGVLGLRQAYRGEGWTHLGTAGDITYRPYSDPQQMALDNWRQAVRRLPRDDENDENDEDSLRGRE
ncbi:hypothetical protein GJ629_11955 [Halapricum sp. CBA1109]|uniref:hypothetical protein n=1 Tax=Halapricum sp. CBA1109 TaxID=2668068 RepID=UPI0012F883BA|nr:hypothetical protein [Halapricum sp. CBA1109]MUV90524.1 hypothetical protein [Halapricum sp. CBA1109]